jgi:hypothetical protein
VEKEFHIEVIQVKEEREKKQPQGRGESYRDFCNVFP